MNTLLLLSLYRHKDCPGIYTILQCMTFYRETISHRTFGKLIHKANFSVESIPEEVMEKVTMNIIADSKKVSSPSILAAGGGSTSAFH